MVLKNVKLFSYKESGCEVYTFFTLFLLIIYHKKGSVHPVSRGLVRISEILNLEGMCEGEMRPLRMASRIQ